MEGLFPCSEKDLLAGPDLHFSFLWKETITALILNSKLFKHTLLAFDLPFK